MFNGWTNHQTWRVATALLNSEPLYEWAVQAVCSTVLNSQAVDAISHFDEVRGVNWLEIVEALREADPLASLCTDNEEERRKIAELVADRTMLTAEFVLEHLPSGLCIGDDWAVFEKFLIGLTVIIMEDMR